MIKVDHTWQLSVRVRITYVIREHILHTRQESSMIHSASTQSRSGSDFCRLILKFWDGRTDALCENSDQITTDRDCGRPRGSITCLYCDIVARERFFYWRYVKTDASRCCLLLLMSRRWRCSHVDPFCSLIEPKFCITLIWNIYTENSFVVMNFSVCVI